MNAVIALVRLAQERGVNLTLSGNEVKVAGRREAVEPILAPLRIHRDELLRWLQADPANDRAIHAETPKADWRSIATQYYLHHFECAQCIAAGRRRGVRCPRGLELWGCYLSVADQPNIQGTNHG